MDSHTWWAFFAAAWAISLSPGPGAVAAMGAGLSHGFARGYCLTFGLVLGILTQVLVVGVGLGAVLAASGWAFMLLKCAGVAYLVFLGVQQWRAAGSAGPSVPSGPAMPNRRRTLVLRGWTINAVNPKGTVFLLAVVPQFIDPSRPMLAQYATIAATLVFTDLVVMAGYTGLASRLLAALQSPAQRLWTGRLFGGLFVLAGLGLALFKRGP